MKLTCLLTAVPALLCATALHAQQQPPKPSVDVVPTTEAKSIDLSNAPVPAADRLEEEPELSEEERKAGSVLISIMPVGFVPPPLIFQDKGGLPREEFRNPMEFPPTVYRIKAAKTNLRLIGAQNQMGPETAIPRKAETTLYYEAPIDSDVAANSDGKPVERLRAIGNFPIPADSTHLVVVLWKDLNEKYWTSPKFKVIDVSPSKIPANGALVVNASANTLLLDKGQEPYKVAPGFMGKVELPTNNRGQVPLYVSTLTGSTRTTLAQQIMGTNAKSRLFLVAWSVPKTAATPTGVGISMVSKTLGTPPKPKGESASAPAPAPNTAVQ